jgi:hypothetical protein
LPVFFERFATTVIMISRPDAVADVIKAAAAAVSRAVATTAG